MSNKFIDIFKGDFAIIYLILLFAIGFLSGVASQQNISDVFYTNTNTNIDICYDLTVDNFKYMCVESGETAYGNNQTYYTVKCHYECDTRYYEYVYGYKEFYDCHISFSFGDTLEMTICDSNQSYDVAFNRCVSGHPKAIENITVIRIRE